MVEIFTACYRGFDTMSKQLPWKLALSSVGHEMVFHYNLIIFNKTHLSVTLNPNMNTEPGSILVSKKDLTLHISTIFLCLCFGIHPATQNQEHYFVLSVLSNLYIHLWSPSVDFLWPLVICLRVSVLLHFITISGSTMSAYPYDF